MLQIIVLNLKEVKIFAFFIELLWDPPLHVRRGEEGLQDRRVDPDDGESPGHHDEFPPARHLTPSASFRDDRDGAPRYSKECAVANVVCYPATYWYI